MSKHKPDPIESSKARREASPIKAEQDYVAFLEKRLASKNWQAQATPEEVEKLKEKLDKARFKLKMFIMVSNQNPGRRKTNR